MNAYQKREQKGREEVSAEIRQKVVTMLQSRFVKLGKVADSFDLGYQTALQEIDTRISEIFAATNI